MGYFGHAWLCTPKVILSICRKFLCLSASKKSILYPMLFCRYCKVMQTYLGYFGHAWLYATTVIVSTCRRIQFLSVFQKQNSPFTSSLTYYILNNPACQIWDWCWTTILKILVLMLDYFQKKLMTKLFKKYKKTYFVAILVVFCPNLGKNEFS